MPKAEANFDHLGEDLRQQLAAHRWSASCYRRFATELSYGRHRGPAATDARPAAVTALFYPMGGQWHLPLILRPASMVHHAGQISLPGGGTDPGETAEMCALRELHEELGVDPNAVTVLGSLPPLFVYASNFVVRPFVAIGTERPAFCPNPKEVEELLELPLSHLMDERNHATHTIVRGRLSFRAPCIEFGGRHIWGATALILGELLEVISGDREGPPAKLVLHRNIPG